VNNNFSIGDNKGLIFNIQRFSIHDGPGIRTVIFLKGCPLVCGWCCNPEGQDTEMEIMFLSERCINCNTCYTVCDNDAIIKKPNKYRVKKKFCNLCCECIRACPSGALKLVGRYYSINEVIKEILKDEIVYYRSNGGITLSGGEPLYQWKFSLNVFKACKDLGINTALETCGYGPWENFKKILEHVDWLFYDIKHIDSDIHKYLTSVDNKIILKNAKRASDLNINMILRFPIISGIHDNEQYVLKIMKLSKELGIKEIHLLPYHKWGVSKYKNLGRQYKFVDLEKVKNSTLEKLNLILELDGFKVSIVE